MLTLRHLICGFLAVSLLLVSGMDTGWTLPMPAQISMADPDGFFPDLDEESVHVGDDQSVLLSVLPYQTLPDLDYLVDKAISDESGRQWLMDNRATDVMIPITAIRLYIYHLREVVKREQTQPLPYETEEEDIPEALKVFLPGIFGGDRLFFRDRDLKRVATLEGEIAEKDDAPPTKLEWDVFVERTIRVVVFLVAMLIIVEVMRFVVILIRRALQNLSKQSN